MIDLDVLAEDYELTHENLKKWFSEETKDFDNLPKDQQEKLTTLRNRIRDRIQYGRDWNLTKHHVYHALDLAWDSPFKQVSPTLLAALMGTEIDEKNAGDTAKKLKDWGFDLNQVVEEVPDPKSKGKTIKRVNVPAFYKVFVPLIRAYVTIRWAAIINDRRLVPFFKYDPAIDTAQNRMKCEAITSRIEVMSRQIGYFEVMKQCVFQMLHYGVCLQFPVEEWWTEEQVVRKASETKSPKSETEKNKTVITKEGIRYHTPHPTRMFWDQAHRISTFNTDTGCEFAGYWRILRFRDIHNNQAYWNRDLVPLGTANWWDKAYTYFQTVYQCRLNFPELFAGPADGSSKDRESGMTNRFYSGVNHLDHTVMLTEYFEKLVPKDNGLGKYPHPVWFRFVVCGDTGTVVYAAPLPYAPVIAYTYDSDELREQNASLSLEILPFQDQFSNLLTQYLLTVQHNLTNLTMIDKDQVEENVIQQLENASAWQWVKRVFIRFSGRKAKTSQQSVPNAAVTLNLTPIPEQGIVQAMRVLLDTLERVLVMSSQEVAQAASHEQTREEVRNIKQQSSTRLTFTETPVDLAREAWKRQLYSGQMSYGHKEFYAKVPFETELDKKTIEKLGFTVEDDDGMTEDDRYRDRKVTVKVKDRTAVMLESFASSRDGDDRVNNAETATAMATLLRDVVNSPYGGTIGPDQFIMWANELCRLAGFPRDFKLVNKMPKGESPEQQKESAKKQLMQIVEMVEAEIAPKIMTAMKPILFDLGEGVKQSLQMDVAQSEAIKTISITLEHLQAALGVSPMPPSSITNAPDNSATQPAGPPIDPAMAIDPAGAGFP